MRQIRNQNAMKNILFIGFKGKNNASALLVNSLSPNACLLTNSFMGLKKDIDNLSPDFDAVYLFGVDKDLKDSFRIEQVAQREGVCLSSKLNLENIAKKLSSSNVKCTISQKPTQYLCNEAYWYMLEKYKGNAVLIHIPTMKNFTDMKLEGSLLR